MTDMTQRMDQQAEQIRRAMIRAFERAYEDAGLRGLCPEGRYEAAIEAVRQLDLNALRQTLE